MIVITAITVIAAITIITCIAVVTVVTVITVIIVIAVITVIAAITVITVIALSTVTTVVTVITDITVIVAIIDITVTIIAWIPKERDILAQRLCKKPNAAVLNTCGVQVPFFLNRMGLAAAWLPALFRVCLFEGPRS